MACHNRQAHPGTGGNEYAIWADRDPHARAYQVLFNDRSRRMVRNLYGPDAPPPEQTALCLKCHATTDPATPAVECRYLGDGVGCESCHGPAKKWRTLHYQAPWKHLSRDEKESLGFRTTKDLLMRAETCVGCHVGTGERDVNHDLIAAGHPRLNFELASFLAVYPRHWSERADKARHPDLEVRVWALGQLVNAKAALELLAARAEPKSGKPWPEFAEYDCYACHHDLREPAWRPQPDEGRRLGIPAGNAWYTAMLPHAHEWSTPPGDPQLTAALDRLRGEMAKLNPNRQFVERQAREAAARVSAWIGPVSGAPCARPEALRKTFEALLAHARQAPGQTWDEAAQAYLAAAAAYHALGDLEPAYRNPRARTALQEMSRRLAFPFRFDSPRDYTPGQPPK